jgi:hypothetical protein
MHDLDRGRQRNQYVLEVTEALLQVAAQSSLRIQPLLPELE